MGFRAEPPAPRPPVPQQFTAEPGSGRTDAPTARLHAVGPTLRRGSEPFTALGANVWRLQGYFAPAGTHALQAHGRTWSATPPGTAREGNRVLARAAAHGLRVIRYITTGWNPVWLRLWAKQPSQFWYGHDALFDAAQRCNVSLIPSLAWHALPFAALAREPIQATFHKDTQAHALLLQYVRAYVTRYRDHPAVLMWELGNEWNLATARGRPENRVFESIDHLEEAMRELVGLIKDADPRHLVGSGHAAPALDQGRDLERQKEAFVRLNRPVDVASLHIYSTHHDPASALGTASVKEYLLAMAEVAASELTQPLMVGEFGESYDEHPDGVFVREVLDSWTDGVFPLALVWSWMAAASSPGGQLASSVDPDRHPKAAALFKEAASKTPGVSP